MVHRKKKQQQQNLLFGISHFEMLLKCAVEEIFFPILFLRWKANAMFCYCADFLEFSKTSQQKKWQKSKKMDEKKLSQHNEHKHNK